MIRIKPARMLMPYRQLQNWRERWRRMQAGVEFTDTDHPRGKIRLQRRRV